MTKVEQEIYNAQKDKVLLHLTEEPFTTAREVSEWLNITPQKASGLLRRMSNHGLVGIKKIKAGMSELNCYYMKKKCDNDKEESLSIELPVKLGTPIYRVLYLNTPDDEYYMSYSPEWVIRGGYFNENDKDKFGDTVFTDYKDAEKRCNEKWRESLYTQNF